MAILHEIRDPKNPGKTITVKLNPRTAIKNMCFECCGFSRVEVDRCTAKLCACWPFRKGAAHSGKVMSAENRDKVRLRFAKRKNSL